MELYKDILAHALTYGEVRISFPGEVTDIAKIIEDDNLEDDACFMKIEKIVSAFEEIGSSGGNRHDYG